MRALSDRPVLGSTVGALVGGRWAISWIAYAINAPVNLIVIGSNAGSSGMQASWTAWLAAAAIGYLAFGAVFLAAHLTLFHERARKPVSMSSVVALGGLAGGVRGIVVGLLAASWGLTDPSPALFLTRILIGVALGGVLVPLVAFGLGCIDAYRTQRSALVTEHLALRTKSMHDLGITREIEDALVMSVRSDLDEVVRTRDPKIARDVSHRIWQESEPSLPEPRMRWSAVLRASVEKNPFATLPVATIWAVAAIGTLTASIGFVRALGQIAFSVASIAILFALGRRLTRRHPRSAIAIVIAILVVLDIITGPIASALFDPRPWPTGASLILANSLWLPLLTLSVGFVVAAVKSSEAVLADLFEQVSDDELEAIAAQDEVLRLRRELATRLHGTVQSKLLSAALLRATDDESFAAWITEIQNTPLQAQPQRPLQARLRLIAEPWSALMDITINVPDARPTGHEDTIVRLVEESLTNAYRHGQATQVRISVAQQGDSLLVTVTDNGRGVSSERRPGLGSAIFDSLAPGRWILGSDGQTTTFTARLVTLE